MSAVCSHLNRAAEHQDMTQMTTTPRGTLRAKVRT